MSDTDRPRRPVREDMRFQNMSWTLQRVGWVFLALIVLCGVAGLFSHGYLSNAVARQDGLPLTVNYDRFQRMTSLHRFDMSIPPGAEDEIRLTFNKAFSDLYEIDSIQPQPLRSNVSDGGLIFTFHPPERGDFNAVLWVRPRSFGYVPVAIGTPRGSLTMPIVVYP
jgi:hypothetical protein